MTDDGTISLPCPGCGDSHEPFQHRTGCAFGHSSGLFMARDGEVDREVALPAIITSPGPDVYPPSRRESIATAALSGILARVDGKLPIQTGDIDRFVAGAASLAVKAADALIAELHKGTP